MSNEPRSCPSAEDLAAFFDGTAGAETREQIRRHVAGCDECLSLLRLAGAYEREHTTARPAAAKRALPRIAAALLIACIGAGAIAYLIARRAPERELLAMIAASGRRTFESRVVGLAYVPYRAARGTDDGSDAHVDAAARALIEQRTASARAWHARGLALLATGRAEEAVQALNNAVTGDDSASYRSDRAAARLTLATTNDDAAELRRALEDADRALHDDPQLLPALFNRALILDRLGDARAAEAYARYVASDPHSQWAQEAQWRASRLGR